MSDYLTPADLVLFYPEGHERHFERGHPERPERIEAIWRALQAMEGLEESPRVAPITLPKAVLEAVHRPEYLESLRVASQRGGRLDADTYVTSASEGLARKAAAGAAAVARAVWTGEARRGFALTRPPGHHATRRQAMGFCLINNVAVAAEYLLQEEGASRLAIVDLDLHHGNGTQAIFWRRGEVAYLSTHQYPFYPGTGRIDETGEGPGEATTLNVPLPPNSGDEAFGAILSEILLPWLSRFDPEMILVSAGFDTHWRDPLGQLKLSASRYGDLMEGLVSWADQRCDGRLAVVLEGGYDLEACAACAQSVASALLGRSWEDPLGPAPGVEGQAWQDVMILVQRTWDL